MIFTGGNQTVSKGHEVGRGHSPHQIPFPGLSRPVGAGSILANLFRRVGVEPCGGCEERKEALDRRVEFIPPGWV